MLKDAAVLSDQKRADLAIKTGIKTKVLEQISVLAEKHGIRQLTLFGSRARGDFEPISDIARIPGEIYNYAKNSCQP